MSDPKKDKQEQPAKSKQPDKSNELDLENDESVAGGLIGSIPGGSDPTGGGGTTCISQS
jgi:hypothetical protein